MVVGDAAEALRLLVGGDQVTTYNEGEHEVHLRHARNRSTEAAMASPTVPSARSAAVAGQRGQLRSGTAPSDISRRGSVGDRVLQPSVGVSGGGAERDPGRVQAAQRRQRLSRRVRRSIRRLGRTANLTRVRCRWFSRICSGGAVRIVAASDHHPLSLPLTLPFALLSITSVAEHLLRARVARVVRRREEELDPKSTTRTSSSRSASTHDAIVQAVFMIGPSILMTTLAFAAG